MKPTIRKIDDVEYVRRRSLVSEAALLRRTVRRIRDLEVEVQGEPFALSNLVEGFERVAERLDYITGAAQPRIGDWEEQANLTTRYGEYTESAAMVTPTVDVYFTLIHRALHYDYIVNVDPGPLGAKDLDELPSSQLRGSSGRHVKVGAVKREVVELGIHLAAAWDCALRMRIPPRGIDHD